MCDCARAIRRLNKGTKEIVPTKHATLREAKNGLGEDEGEPEEEEAGSEGAVGEEEESAVRGVHLLCLKCDDEKREESEDPEVLKRRMERCEPEGRSVVADGDAMGESRDQQWQRRSRETGKEKRGEEGLFLT